MFQVVLVLGVATGVRSQVCLLTPELDTTQTGYILRGSVCVYRLQHELSVLQQQLCESHGLVHSLQCELQVYRGVGGVSASAHTRNMSSIVELDGS